jgi:hypothetical protein
MTTTEYKWAISPACPDTWELWAPNEGALYCTLKDQEDYALLRFGSFEDINQSKPAHAWFVKEEDIDFLIGALQEMKRKVFE